MCVKTRSSPCLTIRLRSTSYWQPSLVEHASVTRARLSLKTWMSMSEPLRTCPVRTLPISRGRNAASSAHQPQGLEPHVAQVVAARFALVDAGEGLDLVADLGVGGQVVGAVAILHAELAWRPCAWR